MRTLRNREEKAFTLVEILVVMLIIGILAAIAIPLFQNQKKNAELAAVRNDVSTVLLAMNSQRLDGKFSTTMPDDVVLSKGVQITIHTSVDLLSTCVEGTNPKYSDIWSASSSTKAVVSLPCP